MNVSVPPEAVAKLEKVTMFRRGKSTPRMMASVARSILEAGLERELALIDGQPIPSGQVFYDAGSTAPETPSNQAEDRAQRAPRPPDPPAPGVSAQLHERLRDLDMLPRRDFGKGGFDVRFKRTWDAYVDDVGSPQEAVDAFVAELDRVERNTGKPIENARAYFMATHSEV